MAGGTWVSQNKVRPGVYINFNSTPQPFGVLGERGITSLALSLPWGAPKSIIPIVAGEDVQPLLGLDLTASALLLLREALKRAKTVLLYRLNSGTAAAVTVDDLTVTARYGGTRGNALTVVIQENVDDDDLFDVTTLLAGVEVDTQTVANIAGLTNNDYVIFSGSGSLTETAGAPLVSGADGAVTNQDHADYLAALELLDFHTLAYTGTDSTLKGVYTSFITRMRDEEGKKVQLVVENYPTADNESVISVKNGVILSDGATLTAAQATAWVAAATAAAQANESLTYSAYDGAVDAAPRYTNSQIETALRAGEFVFTPSQGRVVVEQDINTLISFTSDKGRPFSKNRVIRVLDALANDTKRIFETFYIGRIGNDADGRALLEAEVVSYVLALQGIGAVQNFDSQTDISISNGTDTDAVVIELSIQPVDAVEKLYISVEVR